MQKVLFLLLIVVMLVGCVSKNVVVEKKERNKIFTESLPAWVYELPEGDNFIIGISGKSIHEEQMKDAAKQMAAVMHSRNRASYTISKQAATQKENYLAGGSAGFNLNVSSSPQDTKRLYESMQLLDESFYYGYYLALFADGKADLSKQHKQKFVTNLPAWYKSSGLKLENGLIISSARASSSNLILAWKNAVEQARFEIAKYLEKEVQTALINENDQIEKKYAIETRKKLSKLKISRSYISSKLYDNLRSYEVYLQLTTR